MGRRDDVNIQALWLLGFALFEMWGMGVMGNWRGVGDVVAYASSSQPLAAPLQSIVLAALLALFGLGYRRFERSVFSNGTITGVVAGGMLTTGLLAAAEPGATGALLLGFCLQVVFKYLLLTWFRAFASFDVEIILTYVLAILGSSLICSSLICLLPIMGKLSLSLLAAAGSLVCLRRINVIARLSTSDGTPCRRRTLAIVLMVAFVFCVLFRLIGSAAKRSEDEPILGTFCGVFYAEFGAVVVALGAVVLTAAFLGRRKAARSFTPLPYAMAGGLFALWLLLYLLFPDCRNFALRGLGQISIDLVFILFFPSFGKAAELLWL